MKVYSEALRYRNRGWTVVALDGKKAILNDWPNLDPLNEGTWTLLESGKCGVGVCLGERSGGLVDIDLDCKEAVLMAPAILPDTGARFGHAGAAPSHYIYIVDGDWKSQAWKGEDGDVLVEYRGNGAQTRFPPSDDVVWFDDGDPAPIGSAELRTRTLLLAVAIVVSRKWSKSHRHGSALALAGALKRRSIALELALSVVESICSVTDDEETEDRLRAVRDTYATDEPTTGFPTLAQNLGKDTAALIEGWLTKRPKPKVKLLNPTQQFVADASGIYKLSADPAVPRIPLSNFYAKIVHEHYVVDGEFTRRTYEIETIVAGRQDRIKVDASEFGIPKWIERELGASAIVQPRRYDEFKTAVQHLSFGCPSSRAFAHTGWLELEPGKWAYLHAGGATSAEDVDESVQCAVPRSLSGIAFRDFPTRLDFEAFQGLASLEPRTVTLPAIAAVVRGILNECGLSVFIVGRTGTRKTTLAAILQAFVGRSFDARRLPASFQSTVNGIEQVAYHAKDAPIVVDDYCPSAATLDFQRGEAVLDRLCRSTADGTGRHRSTRDGRLIEARGPRCTLIITAESLPGKESLRQRMVILEQGAGIQDLVRLSACQVAAANGSFERLTHGWIRWIAGRRTQLLEELATREAVLLSKHQAQAHARVAKMASQLEAGMEFFAKYLLETNLARSEEVEEVLQGFHAALDNWKQSQSATGAESDPLELFLLGVSQALLDGSAYLGAEGGAKSLGVSPETLGWKRHTELGLDTWSQSGSRIGFFRDGFVLLSGSPALKAAKAILGNDAAGLPTGIQRLKSLCRDAKICIEGQDDRDKIFGKRARIIRIPYERLFPEDGAS